MDLKLGFATGMNFGYTQAEPSKDGSTRNAFLFSVFVDKPLGNSFSVRPELSLVQRGVQTTLFEVAGQKIDAEVRLDYLELPVMVHYRYTLGQDTEGFVSLGPSLALVLNRNIQVLNLVEVDQSDRFSQTDLMINFGGGFQYRFNPGASALIHLRYNLGLVDIDQTADSLFTRGIQLIAGILFRF